MIESRADAIAVDRIVMMLRECPRQEGQMATRKSIRKSGTTRKASAPKNLAPRAADAQKVIGGRALLYPR